MKYLLAGAICFFAYRAVAWLARNYLDGKRPYTDDEVAEFQRRIAADGERERWGGRP